jgi:hypothetical protein
MSDVIPRSLGATPDHLGLRIAPPDKSREAILEAALECLANGETLSDFCRQPGRPDRRTITRWVAADPVLQSRFTEARRLGHDVIAEATLQLADAPLPAGPDGRIDPALVQQRRLQVDTRLRLLAKWDTARYGDKVQVRGAGRGTLDAAPAMSDEECAVQIEALFARARARMGQAGASGAGERRVLSPGPAGSA